MAGLRGRAAELSTAVEEREARVAVLRGDIEAAAGVNRHLMQRKEEVEWQLMAAMAKVSTMARGISHTSMCAACGEMGTCMQQQTVRLSQPAGYIA